MAAGRLRAGDPPSQVALPQARLLCGGLQPLQPERPQRVQYPVPGPDRARDHVDHRLGRQRGQHRHVRPGHFTGPVAPERPGENRQPGERGTLGRGEQLIAPLDRGPQRLLPGRASRPARHPPARRSSSNGTISAGDSTATCAAASSRASGIPSRRRQITSTTSSCSPPARGSRARLTGARDEQPAGLRQAQRSHHPHDLTRHPEGLPARGQDPQPRAASQQPGRQLRAGPCHVLAIVQHDQQRLVRQPVRQRCLRPSRPAAARPIASATAAATAARSPTEPRSANATVPTERARRRRATSIASRVLPTLPGPSASPAATAATAPAHPQPPAPGPQNSSTAPAASPAGPAPPATRQRPPASPIPAASHAPSRTNSQMAPA